MVNSINTNSKYITVTGQRSANPHISPGSSGSGMIRWNANMSQMEVNDGNIWLPLAASHTTVDLSVEAESLLDWARKKKREEEEMHKLAQEHPAMKTALDAVKRAQEQADLIYKLSIEHENNFGEVQASP